MLTLGLNECFGAGMRQPFVRFRQLAEQYRRIRLRVAVRTGPASAQSASNSSFVMTCLSSPYVALPTRRVRQNSLAPNSGVNSAVTCSADRSVFGHPGLGFDASDHRSAYGTSTEFDPRAHSAAGAQTSAPPLDDR